MPFSAKTDSTITEPPSRKPSDTAVSDTTGRIALRSACLNSTEPVDRPLARAVRI